MWSINVVVAGIGVPLLLAYVYGVVPISLCRNGGCGVSKTDNGGVRIDFDESDVPVETVVSPFAGKTFIMFFVALHLEWRGSTLDRAMDW